MNKAVWNKAKTEAGQVATKADEKADSFLDKLKKSKWTWLILLAGAVVFAVVLLK